MENVVTPAQLLGWIPAALAEDFGKKAADLVLLSNESGSIGIKIPTYKLLRAKATQPIAELLQKVPLRYSLLPSFDELPDSLNTLITQSDEKFDSQCASIPLALPVVVRTSLKWSSPVARPPGVDATVFVDNPLTFNPLVRSLAALYKAYTTCCLKWAGCPLEQSRTAGLILMDWVAVRLEGIAYLTPNRTFVDIAERDGSFYSVETPESMVATGLVSNTLVFQLFNTLRTVADAKSLVEVEFLIDESDTIYILQRTIMEPRSPVMVFHKEGRLKTETLDLRRMLRAETSAVDLRRILAYSHGRILIAPLLDPMHIDGFTLLWFMVMEQKALQPAALLLTYGSGSHSGMKTHIRWMLGTAFPKALVARVPDYRVPESSRSLSLLSDGLTIEIR